MTETQSAVFIVTQVPQQVALFPGKFFTDNNPRSHTGGFNFQAKTCQLRPEINGHRLADEILHERLHSGRSAKNLERNEVPVRVFIYSFRLSRARLKYRI